MKKYYIVLFVLILISAGSYLIYRVFFDKPSTTSQIVVPNMPKERATQTYSNREWGIEFEYPKEMVLKEKVFGNYYSKFNLEVFLQSNQGLDSVFLLNIVLPEFVDTDFWRSQENVSKIMVGGVEGVMYKYEYEGFPHTTVVLPFGDLRVILTTGDGSKPYPDELNKVINSFKFLK